MSLTTSCPHAASILRFLAQRSEQLEGFHSGNARLVVQQFCDFLDRDDVLGFVSQALQRRVDTAPRGWHERALREGRVPPLPEDPAACMAFRYAALKLIRMDKLDLRHFVTNLFPGSYLDEKLMRWKRLIVHPFGADCRTLAAGLIARLPEGDWVDMAALIDGYLDGPFQQEGFGPRAWTDEDDRRVEAEEKARKDGRAPPPRPASGRAAPSSRATGPGATGPGATGSGAQTAGDASSRAALDDLAGALRADALTDVEREDLLLDVAALRVELERPRRARARIQARLDEMASRVAGAAGAAAACARARAALGDT